MHRPPPYYGGYYGAWGYYDGDWMWGVAVGTTVAVAAVSAADDDPTTSRQSVRQPANRS